jgi:hypothetical protein
MNNNPTAGITRPFLREERYYVLKISDMRKYLSREKFEFVGSIAEKLNAGRAVDGKTVLQAVVVEHDWPEYESVWQMIEARVRQAILNPNNDRRFWLIGNRSAGIVSPAVMKAYNDFRLPVTQPQLPTNELLNLLKKRQADTHSCFLLVQDVLALLAAHGIKE